MTSVIRVKRKRLSEPAEALLLARKKAKNDGDLKPTRIDMVDVIKIEEKVFHFAGTVEPEVAHSHHVVAATVKEAMHHRNLQKANSKAVSRKRKLSRFITDTLPNIKQIRDSTVAICQSVLREKCVNLEPQPKVQFRCNESSSEIPGPTTEIVDKQQEGNYMRSQCDRAKRTPKAGNDEHVQESIMCNNIKMFREKLSLSENAKTQDTQSEFVYDLYYCKDRASHWDMTDLLYVQPYRYNDEEFLMESSSDEECLQDDDDDSNDEGNWRNDYPDEDDSSGSSSSSVDEWQMFIQEEEDDLENDGDDVDGGDDDDDDFGSKFREDQAAFDYHDEVEAEVYHCYDGDDDANGGGDGGDEA